MALPIAPSDGDTATIGGVDYIYSAATDSWDKVPPPAAARTPEIYVGNPPGGPIEGDFSVRDANRIQVRISNQWRTIGMAGNNAAATERIARDMRDNMTSGYQTSVDLNKKYSRIDFTLMTTGQKFIIETNNGGGHIAYRGNVSWDNVNKEVKNVVGDNDFATIHSRLSKGSTVAQGYLQNVPGTSDWMGMIWGTHTQGGDFEMVGRQSGDFSYFHIGFHCYDGATKFALGSLAGQRGKLMWEAWGTLVT